MRFRCDQCAKELNIPDEKLPDATRFKVKCPHCERETIVDRSKHEGSKPSRKKKPSGSLGDLEPEVFPPGAKVIFMHMESSEWRNEASSFFKKAGYYESEADSADEAVLKLRLNDYDVLFVEDTSEVGMLMEEIASWNGLKRRNVNVVMLTEAASSMDPMLAFLRGVNFIINTGDIRRAPELLTNALNNYVEYYRWFSTARKEITGLAGG